jgi:hypothetical protein
MPCRSTLIGMAFAAGGAMLIVVGFLMAQDFTAAAVALTQISQQQSRAAQATAPLARSHSRDRSQRELRRATES